MIAEEKDFEGKSEQTHSVRDASGLKGAGGRAGARDARKLDKLRDRKN